MDRAYRVAVIGATGGVGAEAIAILQERGFPLRDLRPFGKPGEEEGASIDFEGGSLPVRELSKEALSGVEIAFFAAPAEVARQYAPEVARHGGLAIDLSPAFRQDPAVPLVVPEVNPLEIGK